MKLNGLLTVPFVALVCTATPARAGTNFCTLTTQDALLSCQEGAASDLSLAKGKCDNVANHDGRQACRKRALTDAEDAVAECGDQDAVRRNACVRFGGRPYDPVIDPANFVDHIDNPYFPLVPGTVFIYEGQTAAGLVRTEFVVTHNRVRILGVDTVEVHDTVFTNGEVMEDTLDWFAQDTDGNVWYFGENTVELIGGRPSTLEGTFTAGVNGAKPGIIMKANPAVGDFYRQEFDLRNAEDNAAVASLSDTVTVPAGTFSNCLKTLETTPLEPDLKEAKWYAPGVGNVLTRDLTSGEKSRLIRIEKR